MKFTSRYLSLLVTSLVVFGASLSPAVRAQVASQSQAKSAADSQTIGAASTPASDADTTSSSTHDGQLMATAAEPDPQASSSAPAAQDQSAPATPPAAPTPLPTPAMTAPLSTAAPAHTFDAGPFGTLSVTGILSGMALAQSNYLPAPIDKSVHYDLSNAQIFLQKTTGWWQFYLQGGAYNINSLGFSYLETGHTMSNLWGPLPVGYVKFVKGGFSAEIGSLPTLIGAEYTFDFENLNIERGLLWNQESAVSKGIQLNEAYKKLSLSVSWNDGFYSNRYNWITGSAAYAFNAANTLSFVAGGNAGVTRQSTFAAPLFQNNSSIYNVIYTYSKGNWFVQPYWQYTRVPQSKAIGVAKTTSTDSFALLFNYNFKHGFSTAFRPEYITNSGNLTDGSVSLLYGPGSNAFGFTFTPTWQKGGFFLRGDLSVVKLGSFASGSGFGKTFNKDSQTRGVIEAGFMF